MTVQAMTQSIEEATREIAEKVRWEIGVNHSAVTAGVRAGMEVGIKLGKEQAKEVVENYPSPSEELQWQTMDNAPTDRPILVKYDHDEDPYHINGVLTDYAVHCESGVDFFRGKGVCIAMWARAYDDDNGWESGQYWTMPAVWVAWFNDDYSEHVLNPVQWMEIPE